MTSNFRPDSRISGMICQSSTVCSLLSKPNSQIWNLLCPFGFIGDVYNCNLRNTKRFG